MAALRVRHSPISLPPCCQTIHCKLSGIVRNADYHIANVLADIVNPEWSRYAFRVAWEIGLNFDRLLAPGLSFTSVISYELFLLRINTDHWKTLTKEFCL